MMRFFTRIALLAMVAVAVFLVSWLIDLSGGERPRWGLTFSDKYAEELGLDAREVYAAILEHLEPRRLRLVAYWDRLAPEAGATDFSALDWQIKEAEERGIEVILAIGYRTPRWPECHIPPWAATFGQAGFEKQLFDHLEALVRQYRASPAIKAWQVENEPLLSVFGECPRPDRELLRREILHVRSLDLNRPILITDSGELAFWPRAAGLGDLFGTTLYRHIWNERLGHFTHVYPPAFYWLRAWLTTRVSGARGAMIAELQGEPWATEGRPIAKIPLDEQVSSFGIGELEFIADFARRTGIQDIYLWGPEWWYWRKVRGDSMFWDFGIKLFADSG